MQPQPKGSASILVLAAKNAVFTLCCSHGSFQYYTTGKNKRLEPTGRRYDGDAIVAGDAWIPNGTGALIDGTSTVYAGDFVHGKPHGIGTYTFDNGDVYEGEMRDGEIHGVGKYTAAGAECSQTVLYRRNKRVCVQNGMIQMRGMGYLDVISIMDSVCMN